MKLWKKIVLLLLAILVAAAAAVVIWQWDNIKAAYTALTTDPDKIAGSMVDIRDEYRQEIQNQTQVEIQLPSLEQSEGLLDGSLTPEDVKDQLGLADKLEPQPSKEPAPEATPAPTPVPTSTPAPTSEPTPAPTATPEPTPSPTPEPKPDKPTAKDLVERCVAELTACQIDLMAQLGGMKQEVLDLWEALPRAEKTPFKKREVILNGLKECYKLEAEIDAKVKAILDYYRAELKAIEADTAVMDTLWKYYEDEKSAQKAYYLNKYMD